MSKIQLRYMQAVAGLLFAASLFMPFMKGTVIFAGSLSVSGLDKLESYDKLIVAILAAALVLTAYKGKSNWGNVALGALTVGLAMFIYSQVSGNVADAKVALSDDGGSYGVASVGFGVYVMLTAAVASLYAGFGLRKPEVLPAIAVEIPESVDA